MSGGGAGPIILKTLRTAMTLSVSPSGSVKLWHVLSATHVLAFVGGLLV